MWLSSGVGEQVQVQATNLLKDQSQETHDWSLFRDLRDDRLTLNLDVLLLGVWNKDHVSSQVTGGLVMLTMGELPREVWNQQIRVKNPTNKVVNPGIVTERTVSTFMGQNPQTKTKETQTVSINIP
jgi:hypothetical protein